MTVLSDTAKTSHTCIQAEVAAPQPLSKSWQVPRMPSSSSIGKRIGFIGAGNMAEALAQGFISKQKVEAKDLWATDISEQRRKLFADFGANASESNAEVGRLAICERWYHFSPETKFAVTMHCYL